MLQQPMPGKGPQHSPSSGALCALLRPTAENVAFFLWYEMFLKTLVKLLTLYHIFETFLRHYVPKGDFCMRKSKDGLPQVVLPSLCGMA